MLHLINTARIFTLDPSIWGNLGWRIQGNWGPSNSSKGSFGTDLSLGAIPQVQFALEPPSNVTLYAGIQGKHDRNVAKLSIISSYLCVDCKKARTHY